MHSVVSTYCITLLFSFLSLCTVYPPGIHLQDTLALSLVAFPSSGWYGSLVMENNTFTTQDYTKRMATSSELVDNFTSILIV